MNAFWLGVASSLAAWAVTLLLIHRVIPTLQGLIWGITDISGQWLAYHDDPQKSEPVGHAEISQTGTRVRMSLHRYKDGAGGSTERDYRYKGAFKARQLTLLWEALDRPDFRMGAMILYLSDDAKMFQGLTVFYHDTLHKGGPGVGSRKYWLKRTYSSAASDRNPSSAGGRNKT